MTYAQSVAVERIAIDDAFIAEWHPKYDLTENDEDEYQRLVVQTASDLNCVGTISKDTFLAIWGWKGALRVIRHVILEEYDSLYAAAFRRAASAPPERKLAVLIAPGVKLPGVEAPTGSTLLHLMHPTIMPIIDVRTVEVLFFAAGLLSTCRRDLAHYEEFRHAIGGISQRCPRWCLREIEPGAFRLPQASPRRGPPWRLWWLIYVETWLASATKAGAFTLKTVIL